MGQTMGQLSVVGEEKKPFRIIVQPPHRENTDILFSNEVQDRGPSLGVLRSCYDASGFVQKDINLTRMRGNPTAVDLDVVPQGMGLIADPRPAAVYRNAPLPDQLFSLPPGGDPRLGQDLL